MLEVLLKEAFGDAAVTLFILRGEILFPAPTYMLVV